MEEFRGQLEDTNEWEYGYYCQTRMGIGFITNDNRIINKFDLHMVIPETVGQFTGFHDINKKKLFDADILFDSELETLLIVYFSMDKGMWMAKSISGNIDIPLYSKLSVIKIVGDKHLNPELLKK